MAQRVIDRRRVSLFPRYWLPVLLYVAMIFTLSAQPHLRPPVEFQNSDKLYHLLEYGGFGWLLARALHVSLRSPKPMATALMAIGLGALLATNDEWFQSTVPGRDSSAFDAMADTLGVTLAQVFYWRRVRRAGRGR